jgi:small-conductance mechanosensitive channel
MDDTLQSFWKELQQALAGYWKGLIHVLPKVMLALIVFFLVVLVVGRITGMVHRRLSGKAHDQLFTRFVSRIIKFVVYTCALILALHILGLTGIAGGLLAGAGVSAFIIGFAFKDIAENFLAGIILAFNRPFSLEDTIKIKDYIGKVEALNFRTTHLKTFDEKDVFIPNATILKEVVTNLTKNGIIRLDFVAGIAFEDDVEQATSLIVQTIKDHPDILNDKEPFVVAEELATNTVNLRVFFWVSTDDYRKGVLITKSHIIAQVKNALSDAGFTLPANIVEMKVYDKRISIPVSITNPQAQQ